MDWKICKLSTSTISDLARLADRLLIWAAMVCSFLSYEKWADAPHERLEQIVSSGKEIALEGQLISLYHEALRELFRDDKEQELFRRVFGAMTVLQESLPLPHFALLLMIKSRAFNLNSLRFRHEAHFTSLLYPLRLNASIARLLNSQ